jgi:uncharacterized protein YceK
MPYRWTLTPAIMLASLVVSGCGTLANLQGRSSPISMVLPPETPPTAFGGVAGDFRIISGACEDSLCMLVSPFLLVDLPFSFIGDTISLPLVYVRHAQWQHGKATGDWPDWVEVGVQRASVPPQPKELSPEVAFALQQTWHFGWPVDLKNLDTSQADLINMLESELTRIGARLAPDGKLRDRSGKEVYFWSGDPGGGCARFEWQIQQERAEMQRRLDELKRTYTVVEVPYWGPQPP